MSNSKLNRKAQRFIIANPDATASKSQRYLVQRLIRGRVHDASLGIESIVWDDAYTAGEADKDIKYLCSCPIKGSQRAPKAIVAAERAMKQVKAHTVPQGAQIDWERMVKSGKLGKVAQKKALVIA